MKHKNIGSDFEDFLRDEGILEEAEELAQKEITTRRNKNADPDLSQ